MKNLSVYLSRNERYLIVIYNKKEIEMSDRPSTFDITDFFADKVQAKGTFFDRSGRVRRRFDVEMNGKFEGGVFVLTEDFVYDDGEVQKRVWRVVSNTNGGFQATAPDIIGVAVGKAAGNVITMNYRHAITISGLSVALTFADKLTRLDNETAVSTAVVTKFGVKIGELAISYARVLA